MSFSRAYYDSCTYDERLGDSASQLDYTMDIAKYVNCKPCRVELGLVGGNETSQAPVEALVDIESSLLGIDRPATRCASYKFQHPDLRRGGDGIDYVQGVGMYKTTCYPKVPVAGQHLPTCDAFLDEREVPLPPPHVPFNCCNSEG